MDTTNNTPEHTVPEVTHIKLEPRDQDQHIQVQNTHGNEDSDIAAANAAKDLFGHDLFHDVQAEEFWNDLLSSDTSEHNLNFFDNVQDSRQEGTTVELESSVKLETTQAYYYQPAAQSTQSIAGL